MNFDENLIGENLMLGSFAFIVNFKRTLFAQMLFAILAKFIRVIFLAFLTNYFTQNLLLIAIIRLPSKMRRSNMFFKTRFTLNNLTFCTFQVNNIDLRRRHINRIIFLWKIFFKSFRITTTLTLTFCRLHCFNIF